MKQRISHGDAKTWILFWSGIKTIFYERERRVVYFPVKHSYLYNKNTTQRQGNLQCLRKRESLQIKIQVQSKLKPIFILISLYIFTIFFFFFGFISQDGNALVIK